MRTTRLSALCLLGAGLLANAGPALSAGDAKRGMNTFTEECGVCHSPKQGKAKLGPPLFGVVGRAAAAAPDFTYSDAMKRSGITWSPDKLDAYIALPRKVVPGVKMQYDGLGDAAARADVIAFLQTLK